MVFLLVKIFFFDFFHLYLLKVRCPETDEHTWACRQFLSIGKVRWVLFWQSCCDNLSVPFSFTISPLNCWLFGPWCNKAFFFRHFLAGGFLCKPLGPPVTGDKLVGQTKLKTSRLLRAFSFLFLSSSGGNNRQNILGNFYQVYPKLHAWLVDCDFLFLGPGFCLSLSPKLALQSLSSFVSFFLFYSVCVYLLLLQCHTFLCLDLLVPWSLSSQLANLTIHLCLGLFFVLVHIVQHCLPDSWHLSYCGGYYVKEEVRLLVNRDVVV